MPIVLAHNEYVFNISLENNPALKANATKNAQIFLKTDVLPVSFDSDSGLISVNFQLENGERTQYVLVDPLSYGIQGFYDGRSFQNNNELKISEKEAIEIAEQEVSNFPADIKSQLAFNNIEKINNYYIINYDRQINDVIVIEDNYKIMIDPSNGKVIGTRLEVFDFSSKNFNTTPTISLPIAIEKARIANNNDELYEKFPQYIVITEDGRLVWLLMLYNKYVKNYYVQVDAKTGEIVFVGTELEINLPKDYPSAKITEEKNNSALYASLIAIILLILIIGYLVMKKGKK